MSEVKPRYVPDFHSQTWLYLEQWMDAEIERLHGTLEQQGVAERDADHARGQIRALRRLKRLAEPGPAAQ